MLFVQGEIAYEDKQIVVLKGKKKRNLYEIYCTGKNFNMKFLCPICHLSLIPIISRKNNIFHITH